MVEGFGPPLLLAGGPEALEIVVGALAGQENVGHHGVEVEKDPAGGLLVAIDRQWPHTFAPRATDHLVCDGTQLSIGLTIADDEVVCDRRPATEVDLGGLPCLLGFGSSKQELRQALRRDLVSSHPRPSWCGS